MATQNTLPIEEFAKSISCRTVLEVSRRPSNEFALQPWDINLKKLLVQVTGQTETESIYRVKIKVVTRDAGLHRLADYTPRLKVLILDGSYVDSLRNLGSSLKFLETLSLVRCSLKSLDGVCGFRSLAILIARDNSIKNPSPCSLVHKLTRLDLVNNEIEDPTTFAFLRNCKHLRILDVAGNCFDNYRDSIMTLVPQIRVLDGENTKAVDVAPRASEGEQISGDESDLTSEDEDLILFSEDEDSASLPVDIKKEKCSSLKIYYRKKSREECTSQIMGAGDVEIQDSGVNNKYEKFTAEDHVGERSLDPSSSSIYLLTHEFDRLSMLDLSAVNVGTTGAAADTCGRASDDRDVAEVLPMTTTTMSVLSPSGVALPGDFISIQYLLYSHGISIPGNVDVSNLNVSMVDWYSKGRENPMPSEIKVTSWQNMPYSGLKKNAKGEYEGTGYAFQLLKLIQSKLNFTYTIIPPKREILGDRSQGVMAQLFNKEVDMAVAFIPMLSHLEEICTFSGPIDEVEITFMMKRPRESAVRSGLLAPFNNTVWLCILAALIIVGPVIYILIYIRSKISKRGHPEGYPLSTCIWFTYGALLKQGSTVTPVTDSARLLFATWWIFITILTSFYTANLTAFLTLSEYTLPYKSIEEITAGHKKWVSFVDHTVDNSLKRNNQDELKALKESISRRDGTYINSRNKNITSDFQVVRDKVNSASGPLFIGEKYFIEDLIFDDYRTKTINRVEESKRCTLVMLPQNLFVNNRGFAYPKKSLIAEHIDRHLRNLVETGIVKHLKKEALPSVQYCPLNLKSTERRLRNADLSMTYYCVGVGFALAIVVFFGELIHRLVHLRKSLRCGECCSSLCCRSKMKSAVLPIYNHDSRPDFLGRKDSPIYESPYNGQMAEQQVINGRDYWVIREQDGDRRLVPVRSPSALLFQYASYLEVPNSISDIPKF